MFSNSRIFLVRLFSRKQLTSCIFLLFMTILCLLFQAQFASAAQVTLQWDDKNEPGTIAGYNAYCGTSTGNYSITQNVQGQTSCTFTDLQEGIVHHFAVKAYSSTGVESDYSEELVYLIPETIDTVTDTDGDGITDYDETNTYHTDPLRADTDGDGLNDGDEINLYGTDPLNADTDGDGFSDGEEVNGGSDPLNSGSIPSVPSNSGAVAHWEFNEGSGQSTADSNGGGYEATLVNNPEWVSHGADDPALHFDGIQSFVDTGFDQYLPNWTVSLWVKGDNAPGSTKDTGPIMRQENYMITWDHRSAAYRGAATVCVKGKWYAASFGALDPDTWYYLTATYDGETLRTFKDGQLITENPKPSGPADDSPYTAKIGRHTVTDEYFAGTVDDVRIFDFSLTAGDVATLYEEEVAALVEDDPVSDTTAHWQFNEGSGQSTADSSGGGYAATLVNNPEWVSHGAGDPALHFDGIQSFVDTGFDQHLANWTVSVWVKGDNAPGSTKDAGPIMKQENYMITWDHRSATFRGAATVCANGTWHAASFGALDPNVWYHLTATYDGETLRAFKDGQLVTENPNPSGPADASPYTAKIGRHALVDEYFAGTVDDVRIYDYSLTGDEVAALHEEEVAALVEDDPVSDTTAHWQFNEGSGQSTADSSGGGYAATLVNNPEWVSHNAGDPALHFDGIQSFVDTGFDQHLPNWTVSVWVKGDNAPGSTKDAGPIMKQENYMITWDHRSATYRGAATVCANGAWHAASFGALDPDVWYCLTATYDGETLRAFKDGQLVTENPNPSGPAGDSPYTAKIGRHAVTDVYFAGTVDDVRIYDRALNENEVAALYGYENY